MTGTITKKINSKNKSNYSFGGEIYQSDFNTEYSGKSNFESSIASRIMSDWRFDKMCQQNSENKVITVGRSNTHGTK